MVYRSALTWMYWNSRDNPSIRTLSHIDELSHPPNTMNTMKHHPTPSEELREAYRRARTAVSDLSRATGGGLSRSDLELLAVSVKRIEAVLSSVKCDLARQVTKTQGKAGAGRVLRDRLGMTGRQAAK